MLLQTCTKYLIDDITDNFVSVLRTKFSHFHNSLLIYSKNSKLFKNFLTDITHIF